MSNKLVLYGAGTIGGLIARQLKDKGEPPLCFADNDLDKGMHEGISVWAPQVCRELYPDAKWVATVHRDPARQEIVRHIEEMGVESVSLYDFLPARTDLPPGGVALEIIRLCADNLSRDFFWDQCHFRTHGVSKMAPADIRNVYFEDFYTRLENEHFVDCGAADGDTVADFRSRWNKYGMITGFEPDSQNFLKASSIAREICDDVVYPFAVSDHNGFLSFSATGDQTSHIDEDGEDRVRIIALDGYLVDLPPTLIKMDIEGSELEGLWGARKIIKEHSPVLAICAYHKGPDLWEIPLLIHALNPEYKLYFRRYLEATWELIWYAVPPERVA